MLVRVETVPHEEATMTQSDAETTTQSDAETTPPRTIPGGCLTSAMGILPHRDPERALDLAFSLDIPFWPQLPRLGYGEDMYVQVAAGFPGIVVDWERERIRFSRERFDEELIEYSERMEDPDLYRLTSEQSVTYREFLSRDLSGYVAIRGQMEGPVSFGFNVEDDAGRALLYDDEIRPLLFDFVARKVEVMRQELCALHPRAFMFVDEPGMEFIFSSLSGYTDVTARQELRDLLAQVQGARGIHLCGNPSWDFLLGLPMQILSFNAFGRGEELVASGPAVRRFLQGGGVLGWGIVPSNYDDFHGVAVGPLVDHLERLFDQVERTGVDRETIFDQSLLLPATCSLVNPDGASTVELCYDSLREVSRRMRARFGRG